jgi:hypothetical protein
MPCSNSRRQSQSSTPERHPSTAATPWPARQSPTRVGRPRETAASTSVATTGPDPRRPAHHRSHGEVRPAALPPGAPGVVDACCRRPPRNSSSAERSTRPHRASGATARPAVCTAYPRSTANRGRRWLLRPGGIKETDAVAGHRGKARAEIVDERTAAAGVVDVGRLRQAVEAVVGVAPALAGEGRGDRCERRRRTSKLRALAG